MSSLSCGDPAGGMSEEIKSCPCCDGKSEVAHCLCEFWVRCGECCLETPLKRSPTEAIAAWNTRAVPVVDDENDSRIRHAQNLADERDKALADNQRLQNLLKECLPFVVVTDYDGRSEDEMRQCYPDSSSAIDQKRERIIAALGQGGKGTSSTN